MVIRDRRRTQQAALSPALRGLTRPAPETIPESATLTEAAMRFAETGDPVLVVVDSDGRVRGVLDREGAQTAANGPRARGRVGEHVDLPVRLLRHCASRRALDLGLPSSDAEIVPVVDDDGRLLGVVHVADLDDQRARAIPQQPTAHDDPR